MNQLTRLLEELRERGVRYVAMGVWGANHYAKSPAGILQTRDRPFLETLREELRKMHGLEPDQDPM